MPRRILVTGGRTNYGAVQEDRQAIQKEGIMKASTYAFWSAMSFVVAGNLFEAQRGWIGWQTVPPFFFILVGYHFMDEYAKRYE